MRVFDTSEILPNEIDGLGHLNVRYHSARAQRANGALMAELGLGPQALAGAKLMQMDTYCRYQREQFQGATLTVNGGVLKASDHAVTCYFELRNPKKGEIASCFVLSSQLVDRASGAVLPLPEAALAAAMKIRVELPEHGRPRTIDLGPPRLDIAFEDLAARLTEESTDPMSRTTERRIEPDECDEFGFLAEHQDLMFGGLRMPRPAENHQFGPMTFVTDEGHRMGWAALETRNVRVSQARVGETVCSIGAEVGLLEKVRHSRRWMFNLTTGKLVSLNDNVAIALDLDARRSIPIPASMRGQFESRHVPEFA
jgi:acyl-CoA thioester hydrolase